MSIFPGRRWKRRLGAGRWRKRCRRGGRTRPQIHTHRKAIRTRKLHVSCCRSSRSHDRVQKVSKTPVDGRRERTISSGTGAGAWQSALR